jgi:hypothetical protein
MKTLFLLPPFPENKLCHTVKQGLICTKKKWDAKKIIDHLVLN